MGVIGCVSTAEAKSSLERLSLRGTGVMAHCPICLTESGVKKLSVSAFFWFGVCKWGSAVTKAWTPRGSRGEHSERSLAAEPCPTEVSSVGHKHVTQAHNEGWRARNEKSPQGESSFCRCPSQSPLQFFLCESRLGLMPLANASPRRKW